MSKKVTAEEIIEVLQSENVTREEKIAYLIAARNIGILTTEQAVMLALQYRI